LNQPLRVLLLEDSAADAELIERVLDRAGYAVLAERVDSREAFALALRDFQPDIVLSDSSLAEFNAPSALAVLRALRPGTPLLVVSGMIDERTAVDSLRAGAEDYVVKDHLERLPASIDAALLVRERLKKLTPRQLEVLRLVVQGHTTREIARRLRLSAKTIETHRGEVMRRLEIHDVVGLVRYAIRVGLVAAEE
jgi:DNA-binding NarL/FixJ family response regulator